MKFDADGMRLTDCCGSYSTFCDWYGDGCCDTLVCKRCYQRVNTGEGDGNDNVQNYFEPVETTDGQ